MPDGTPCWCLEPREGQLHAPVCMARRVDRVLVIDDVRTFRFPATYARTTAEAIPLLFRRDGWREVWWDYDLGETTGSDTTRHLAFQCSYLKQYGSPPPIDRVVVHTANPVGAEFLVGVLGKVYDRVERVDASKWLVPGPPRLTYVGEGSTD